LAFRNEKGRADRRRLAPWLLVVVAASQGSCVSRRPIAEVLRDHTPELMALPGVIGTGEGAKDGKPVILVIVAAGSNAGSRIPHEIEGYPVVLQETGPVRALGGK